MKAPPDPSAPSLPMKIQSDSFSHGDRLPESLAFVKIAPENHVTFAGNRNPHLAWSEVPDGTRSFAILCVDTKAPTSAEDVGKEGRTVSADLPRANFYHWGLVDLPPSVRSIEEGSCSDGVTTGGKSSPPGPEGCLQGETDYTGWFADDPDMKGTYVGYDGPAPPWNDALRHEYHFRVYALSVDSLGLAPGFAVRDLEAAVEGKVLAEAELVGWYTTNPDLA